MPGVPMMGEHRLSYPAFKDNSSSLYARLCQMRDLISPATYLWFRCSSFFSGEMGRNAVEHFTNFFRCKLVGHTHKIGFIQSGCYVVDIKDKPRWPVTEAAQSFFYEPNTILATNFFPCVEWGYQPDFQDSGPLSFLKLKTSGKKSKIYCKLNKLYSFWKSDVFAWRMMLFGKPILSDHR